MDHIYAPYIVSWSWNDNYILGITPRLVREKFVLLQCLLFFGQLYVLNFFLETVKGSQVVLFSMPELPDLLQYYS